MNTCVSENEITSGSDTTSYGIPAVDDSNTKTARYALPRLTSTNSSSKKMKSPDDFLSSIKMLWMGHWRA